MKKRIVTLIAVLLVIVATTAVFVSATIKPGTPVLKASNVSSTGKNKITWEETSRAAFYRVYRSKTEDGEYSLVKSTSGLSYTDTKAKVGQTYYYCVKAVRSNKTTSNTSKKVKLTCKLSRPKITLSNIKESGKIKVKWKKISKAKKYEVYRATSKKGKYSLIKTTKSTSLVNTSTKAGKRYYYKVRAIASKPAANSARSEGKSQLCMLSKPTLGTPKLNSDGKVILSWKSVSGTKNYYIYRSEKETGDYKRVATVKEKPYIDKKVVEGKTYYYKIRAAYGDPAVDSICSDVKNIKIVKTGEIVVGELLGEEGVPSFVWNAVEGAKSYKVYRSFYEDKNFTLLSTRTECKYTNQSVPQGLTLYYKIVALDGSGKELATSRIIKFTTKLKKKETLKTRYLKHYMVNLYTLPEVGSASTRIRYMEELSLGNDILSRTNGKWYRVFYKGNLYYLWSENINTTLTTQKSTFKYTGNTIYQQEIVDFAVEVSEKWKTVYSQGHSSGIPNSEGVYGFNCSGFIKFVFDTVMQKHNPVFGFSADVQKFYETKGVCNAGYAGEFNAKKVSINDLQPGDVLFFKSLIGGSSNAIKHCGIYLGNNEFVHSTSNWEDAVSIISLTGHYRENFVGARRYLPDKIVPANEEATVKGPYKKYKVFKEKSIHSTVIKKLYKGDKVTVLFTDSEKWAYIETASGVRGCILLQYLA